MYPSSHFHQEIARDRHAQLLRDAAVARRREAAMDELESRPGRLLLRLARGRAGRRAVARVSFGPAG